MILCVVLSLCVGFLFSYVAYLCIPDEDLLGKKKDKKKNR